MLSDQYRDGTSDSKPCQRVQSGLGKVRPVDKSKPSSWASTALSSSALLCSGQARSWSGRSGFILTSTVTTRTPGEKAAAPVGTGAAAYVSKSSYYLMRRDLRAPQLMP